MARSGRDHNAEEQLELGSWLPVSRNPAEELSASHDVRDGGKRPDDPEHCDPSVSHSKVRPHDRTHYSDPERDRTYNLRDSEINTLAEIGTFRTLTVEDLAHYRYAGDNDQARRDLDNLARKDLIRIPTTEPQAAGFVALSPRGHSFITQHRSKDITRDEALHNGYLLLRKPSPEGKTHDLRAPKQILYYGFVKPREAKHDAALYPLYHQEVQRITREGGRVNRIVLDFELKSSINRKLSTIAALPEPNRAQCRHEIAREHGLTLVDGKILVPDLRIEYEDRDHQQTKVDIELATGHYHRDTLVQKARAGFAVFREQSQGGRSAEHDHGLMRDVFSL